MIRLALLLAAGSLASLSVPALAQEEHAPALPPLDEAAEASPADAGADYAADPLDAVTEPAPGAADAAAALAPEEASAAQPARPSRLGYSPEERAAWLVQCHAVYGDNQTCETYLARYELAATDPQAYARRKGCADAAPVITDDSVE